MRDSKNHDPPKSGFTRRSFFKGSGAVAAAAALANSPAETLAQAKEKVAGKGWKTITLNVNGQPRQVKTENRTTLLEVLRYELELTGAKPISGDGSSGGSTVLLDGKPVTASTTLAVACAGKKIETVESLGAKLDAVPREFVKHDAQQCGFCTPGFVVAVRAFLDKNPNATEEEIRKGLNGNICRCGTYASVLSAAVAVAKGGR
ncbi:MAG: (2Fe-2S)-binding protein [Planctomycetales bacterium]